MIPYEISKLPPKKFNRAVSSGRGPETDINARNTRPIAQLDTRVTTQARTYHPGLFAPTGSRRHPRASFSTDAQRSANSDDAELRSLSRPHPHPRG